MRHIILDSADEVVFPDFEGSAEEAAAKVPPGSRAILRVEQPPEHMEEAPVLKMPMLKLAVFNSDGFPINVIDVAEDQAANWIGRLPPTHTAVTLTGTPFEAVQVAGDLPPLADLEATSSAAE